jgi:hypothetical protein
VRRIVLAESFSLSAAEQTERRAERARVSAAVEARRAELALRLSFGDWWWRS